MKKKPIHLIWLVLTGLWGISGIGYAQADKTFLSLERAILIAKERSPWAQMARFTLMRQYWNHRSYKAELLPSLNLSGNALNYNRSIVDVRDAGTGQISYVSNNSLANTVLLSIDQNIPFLGGTLSLESYLSHLEQFDYDKTTFNTNPLALSYRQPLRTYNSLKWDMKTAPLVYEQAKRAYLESMQTIAIQTTSLFFSALSAQSNYEKSLATYNDRKDLFNNAQNRFELLGTVMRSEILQLELSLLNAEMSVNTSKLNMETQLFNLCLYLGMTSHTRVELVQPSEVPQLSISADLVLDKALTNSTHALKQNLKLQQSQRALAQAKSAKGLQATLSAHLGFSQTGDRIGEAYQNLREREVVGISFRLPIYDWEMSKGKVKMAQADLAVTQTEIEQADLEFRQDISTKVVRFNNQLRQCEISARAKSIAEERYKISKNRFENGMLTVTELNTAQNEYDAALSQYINQLQVFWSAYYEFQKIALYDFIHKIDLSADFNKIVDNLK